MAPRAADERTALLATPDCDLDNPLNWPRRVKWRIVAVLFFASFTVTANCMAVMPVARHIVNDLADAPATTSSTPVLLVTIWELGEAAGPLLIGPLSEVAGRYAIVNAAGALFALSTLLAALARSVPQLIAARALTGMAVASNVLNPAIVGDLFPPEERGAAMSLIMFAPLLGGTVGPALAGFLAETCGWRALLFCCVLLAAAAELAFLFAFRETYHPVIARRRIASQGQDRKKTARPRRHGLGASVLRPAVVLLRSGVVAALALFGSVVFALIYVLAVSMPVVLEDVYRLSPRHIGFAFLANALGAMFSVLFCKLALDRVYVRLRDANHGLGLPEHRLPMCIIGALTLPPALALYGWCAHFRLPLALFIAAVICMRFSILLVLIPLMAYVVDACAIYSASALTGVIVLRCLSGAFVPLAMAPTVDALGYGWAFTALALVCLTLALVPLAVQRYGQTWRRSSPFTSGGATDP